MSKAHITLREGLQTTIKSRGHVYHADEPESNGGSDTMVSPMEMALGALGSCIAITMRLYADRKGWPLEGVEVMAARRHLNDPRILCAGPGRLCQALGITRAHDGHDLTLPGGLWVADGPAPRAVVRSPRIGISVAMDRPWRFVEKGTRYASRPALSRRG